MKNIKQKFHYFDLLWELIKTSFKLRYQNSVLGFLWVLIKPYSTFMVQYFVWTRVVRQDIPDYGLYLLLGVIVYTYFNELILLGQISLLERAGIILKVNFPRQVAVVSALVNAVINLGINSILFFILAYINNLPITLIGILYYCFLMAVLFIFGMGVSFFTSILTVRLRDLKMVFELGLFLLFWLTPIMYSVSNSDFAGDFADIVRRNPLGILIGQARTAMGVEHSLNLPVILTYLVVSIIILIFGWMFFNSRIKKIAEYF